MIPAKTRSKRANRIQRYLGVQAALDSQEPEFLFCSGGFTPPPLLGDIRVVLSPLEDERLSIISEQLC